MLALSLSERSASESDSGHSSENSAKVTTLPAGSRTMSSSAVRDEAIPMIPR